MELSTPFWTDPDDVNVDIMDCGVSIHVRGSLAMRRTYWRNACAHCTHVQRCPQIITLEYVCAWQHLLMPELACSIT